MLTILDNHLTVWDGIRGKLDFYNTPVEKRNIFSRLRFSEKIHKKGLEHYDHKNIEDLSKSSKNFHEVRYVDGSWEHYVLMGQQCISRRRSTEKCLADDL